MSTPDEWDAAAATFDDAPDHGLADERTRAAWRDLLIDVLPGPPARVADLGCGTGTLSLLLAEEGYVVDGVDFAPEMVRRAAAKAESHGLRTPEDRATSECRKSQLGLPRDATRGAARRNSDHPEAQLAVPRDATRGRDQRPGGAASFVVGDAAAPPLPQAAYDVVLSRHVLWALPDPVAALRGWTGLLVPGGRLVLVEGSWHTGAGLTAQRCAELVGAVREQLTVTLLTDPVLWGGPITDERYLLFSLR